MSRRKTERLLSLVVCLLSARRYLTAAQIREAVPGYPESFDAFKRMFERDKDELRELGIPLEMGTNVGGDEEQGYLISRQAYELPDIRLEPDEAAVLGLAARVWRRAELAGAAEGALLKLRAAGVEPELDRLGIEPRVQTPEPFGKLWQAVRDRRPVTFSHVAAGRSTPLQRRLEPWGVVSTRGRWYVVGYDTDRGAERVFRLSRIAGPVTFTGPAGTITVPDGVDVRASVGDWDTESAPPRTCLLRVRSGAGHGLRRRAISTKPAAEPGWDVLELAFSDTGWWSEDIASFGADVVVLEPSDLRDAVIGRFKGAGVTADTGVGPRSAESGTAESGMAESGTAESGTAESAKGRSAKGRSGRGQTATAQPESTTAQSGTAAERLQRLLALVPYVTSRHVVGLAETAATFGVTERELVDDLNMLWCVELRSPDPYCPIDLSYEGGEIQVSEGDPIGRPLRLAVDEASALLIALRWLAETPGIGRGSAISRTIAKLEQAAGSAAVPRGQVDVRADVQEAAAAVAAAAVQIADAISDQRRLHISYYVPGRDEATERDVDPMRLLLVDGRSYLEGWCRRADAVRLFRLDRILDLRVLDVRAEVPGDAEHVDVDSGLFRPSPQDLRVVFDLGRAGRWVAGYYPCERQEELADGRLRVQIRTPDTEWVRRLALRLGDDGRLVSPPELARQVVADAQAALDHYA